MTELPDSLAEATEASDAARLPRVHGQTLERLPEDLYIPPDALEVFLDAFEGPLDLLLYLIRKQNLDILDIPVFQITQQYMRYIELMQELRLELAGEYLVMAAWLAEIKSRLLLPKPVLETEEAGDPRVELVRRLQEYERFKTAAENLDALPRLGRDFHLASARPEQVDYRAPLAPPRLREVLGALRDVLMRAELFTRHQVAREPLSVRDRMSHLLTRLRGGPRRFTELLVAEEGPAGVVVSLLAVLELAKLSMVEVVQEAPFAEILIDVARAKATTPARDAEEEADEH